MSEKRSGSLPWRHVLLTTDLSPAAESAFEAAADLARRVGARVTVLNVIDLAGLGDSWAAREALLRQERQLRDRAMPRLEVFCAQVFKDVVVKIDVIEGVGTADTICQYAREKDVDLIVIATHGHTGWKHFFIGSVAERVVQGAPCDVIALRSPAGSQGS